MMSGKGLREEEDMGESKATEGTHLEAGKLKHPHTCHFWSLECVLSSGSAPVTQAIQGRRFYLHLRNCAMAREGCT